MLVNVYILVKHNFFSDEILSSVIFILFYINIYMFVNKIDFYKLI